MVNTSVTAALPGEQLGAVNDYNNIWLGYETVINDKPFTSGKRITANVFADYAFKSGWFKGVRVGLGAQYRGDIVSGYRTADTIAVNGTTQLEYGPAEGLQHAVETPQPLNTVMNMGYTWRPKKGWLADKRVDFQLNVRNLLNKQGVFYQDDTVVPRPPDGDFNQPNRVSVPAKLATFQEPRSFIFTATLKL